MIALVTLAQAKAHLAVDHALDDNYIQGLVYAASRAVANYVTAELVATWIDSSGNLIPDTSDLADSSNQSLVPEDVRHATLLLIGDFYANREPTPTDPVDAQFGYAYLPRAVVALLWPYHLPGLGVPDEAEVPITDSSGLGTST